MEVVNDLLEPERIKYANLAIMKKTKEPKIKLNFESCYNYKKLKDEGLVDEQHDDEIVRIHTTHNDGVMNNGKYICDRYQLLLVYRTT